MASLENRAAGYSKFNCGGAVMEPTRKGPGALADVLDRLLDKGVVLDIDLIIGVADIPLIGINLRVVIAALETMLDYGFMKWLDKENKLANSDR